MIQKMLIFGDFFLTSLFPYLGESMGRTYMGCFETTKDQFIEIAFDEAVERRLAKAKHKF